MDNEIWKDIPGFNGRYQASSLGRIKSSPKKYCPVEKIMSTYVDVSNGGKYRRPSLRLCRVTGSGKIYRVSRLVAAAFVDNPENKTQVNHKDGNPLNNHYSNLEWVTKKENTQHASKNGLLANGERHGMAKLTQKDVDTIRKDISAPKDIAAKYGVTRVTIYRIKNFNNWKLPASAL